MQTAGGLSRLSGELRFLRIDAYLEKDCFGCASTGFEDAHPSVAEVIFVVQGVPSEYCTHHEEEMKDRMSLLMDILDSFFSSDTIEVWLIEYEYTVNYRLTGPTASLQKKNRSGCFHGQIHDILTMER
jgi:hypothetical protein